MQEIELKNPQPAYVKIYDYYDTGDKQNVFFYFLQGPCMNIYLL